MRERFQFIKWNSLRLLSIPVSVILSVFAPLPDPSTPNRILVSFLFVINGLAIIQLFKMLDPAGMYDARAFDNIGNEFQQEFESAVNECNQKLPFSTLSKVSGYWKVIPYLESKYIPQQDLNKIQNEMRESFKRVVGVLSDEVVVNVLCKGDAPELRSEMVDYVNDLIKSEKKNMVDIGSRFKKMKKESIQEHKRQQRIKNKERELEKIEKRKVEAAKNEARSRQTAVLAEKMLNEVYLNKGK